MGCGASKKSDEKGSERRRRTRVAGAVQLRIVRGKGLRAADRAFRGEPSSDPYCKVLDSKGNEVFRTNIVHKSLDPEWDFGGIVFIGPGTPTSFSLEVWDWDRGAKDDALGVVEVNLLDLVDEEGETELELRPHKGKKAQGTIAVTAQEADSSDLQGSGLGGLGIVIARGSHVPKMDLVGQSDSYVKVQMLPDGLGGQDPPPVGKTRVRYGCANPLWNDAVFLGDASGWDLDKAEIQFSLYEVDRGPKKDTFIGQATMLVRDVVKRESVYLLMSDANGDAVLGSQPPHLPCELKVGVLPDTMPAGWPKPTTDKCTKEDYPRHIFMMSRGTRGDVQPFVALARGMAALGWMVTICTELKWKGFVKKHSTVLVDGEPKGRIRFLPSGGDTERRVNTASAKWAMASKGEILQATMLAFAEAEFFGSCSVFVHHILRLQETGCPVDLIVFGFTTAGAAVLASERCAVPCAGFILQPSSIPSSDPEWKAVIAIESHAVKTIDRLEETYFTSHETLATLKKLAEAGWVGKHSLRDLRKKFGLRPAPTWDIIRKQNIPLVIPMEPETFRRPADWGDRTVCTTFIFLRSGSGGGGALSDEIENCFAAAKEEGRKVVVMTFSSMPVRRESVYKTCNKMVRECKVPVTLFYIGALNDQEFVGSEVRKETEGYISAKKLIMLRAADFGALFPRMDAFVVHGGLGTTVEALRLAKPIAITGPLLMDQRFWGQVVHAKGIGPAPVHFDRFGETCVKFLDGALDPSDPEGWQASAAAASSKWGDPENDGVDLNVEAFQKLVAQELQPVSSE